ncbi:molecular chaperone TorD family protein [Shewanella sp. KX20019]|uniref:TorD/DmsD family molecular chaperone n=1 Tax=Shewanella sp. KX20019 TaxID=2803864 RepID=UPI001927F827|nr:molecular chaperone TorD family protein [Shewanella sp. KX20019]QQX78977.1 molecular chaperone TorD family protein [Shewanella sp. KX20019]
MSSNTVTINSVDFIEYQGLARILHHCLIRHPEAELVQGLKDCDVAGSWPEFAHREQNIQGREAFAAFLQQWPNDDNSEQLIELKLDYGQLFFGPGEPNAVAQGSVYLSEAQLLNDRSTMALKDFYQVHGVDVDMDYPQPVDHIALFFAVLDQTFGRLEVESDNLALIRFTQVLLQQHFLPWAYRCFELALAHANTDFYRGIALLGNDLLLQMQQDFQLVPKETRLYR